MNFGHEVGEVELQVVEDGPLSDEEKVDITVVMYRRIDEFMECYKRAGGMKGAKGKLTA
jgi:hypothetical protein